MNRSLNLMPESSLRRRARAEAAWLWTRVLLLAALAAVSVSFYKAWQGEDARQRAAALSAEHQPIQQLRSELQVLRERIKSVCINEALPLSLAESPRVLSVLSGAVDAAKVLRGEGYLDELSYETDALAGVSPTLAIEGVAREPGAIQRFIAALNDLGYFSEVRLGETEARLMRGTATTAFQVECSL